LTDRGLSQTPPALLVVSDRLLPSAKVSPNLARWYSYEPASSQETHDSQCACLLGNHRRDGSAVVFHTAHLAAHRPKAVRRGECRSVAR